MTRQVGARGLQAVDHFAVVVTGGVLNIATLVGFITLFGLEQADETEAARADLALAGA